MHSPFLFLIDRVDALVDYEMDRNSEKVGRMMIDFPSCFFQSPVYAIEYEERHFRPDLHVRYHASNPDQGSRKMRKRMD